MNRTWSKPQIAAFFQHVGYLPDKKTAAKTAAKTSAAQLKTADNKKRIELLAEEKQLKQQLSDFL